MTPPTSHPTPDPTPAPTPDPSNRTAPVVLLTDFGLDDHYVGVMKGVIASIAPGSAIYDLGHTLAQGDIAAASFLLQVSYRYFPSGSVFCAVVDPGVGSARRAVAVQGSGRSRLTRNNAADNAAEHAADNAARSSWCFVAPDNGLLGGVLEQLDEVRAVDLDDPSYHLPEVSRTFHGRDIFAPVAAHLARGTALEQLGSRRPADALQRLELPEPQQRNGRWHATVIHVDRFGNLITNLPGEALAGRRWRVFVAEQLVIGPSVTFADVPAGSAVAYVGSSGLLELALRNGNAAAAWGARVGSPVVVEPLDETPAGSND